MAFNDTLFQLGMDLTRSSTAQEEDISFVASVVEHSVSEPSSKASNSGSGHHLSIDLHGTALLSDAKSAERALSAALKALGKPLKSVHVAKLANSTLSGVAVLPVGHWSFQAHPDNGFACIDVRGCVGLDTHAAMFALSEAFGAREAVIQKTRHSDVVFLPASVKPAKARAIGNRTKQAKAA